MPRFFFDIRDGDNLTRDNLGVELESADRARDEAYSVLIELAHEAGKVGSTWSVFVSIRDDAGKSVLQVDLPVPVEI